MGYGKVTKRELDLLRAIVGSERMSTGKSVLDLHGKDESFHPKRRPEVVVWPLSAEEISQILNIPLGTVKSRVNRGRLKLQEDLKFLLDNETTIMDN